MAELILHHYWESPYAEKIRRVMGMKGLVWRSVIIPMIMPKPDLTALTGGYRKTPVLQIGADVYCDTDLIARTIDRPASRAAALPRGLGPLCLMLGAWQQELFWLAVREVGVRAPIFPPGFLEDRSAMDRGRPLARAGARRRRPRSASSCARSSISSTRHLRERRFVLGDARASPDLSLFHPVFCMKIIPATAETLAPYAHLRAWLERIEAFGHGAFTEMQGPRPSRWRVRRHPRRQALDPSEPNGLRPGDRVEIVHESFGHDPVAGELVASSAHEIAIARQDARAGDVVVHLPREHYRVKRG
jgi:glutathione S-transferase